MSNPYRLVLRKDKVVVTVRHCATLDVACELAITAIGRHEADEVEVTEVLQVFQRLPTGTITTVVHPDVLV